jgi:hypothetical protein
MSNYDQYVPLISYRTAEPGDKWGVAPEALGIVPVDRL